MKKNVRWLGAGAATGLLALTALATGAAQADAATAGTCDASGVHAACATSRDFIGPAVIAVNVTSGGEQGASIAWTVSCVQGNSQHRSSGSFDASAPYVHVIPHPFQDPDYCSAVVTVYTDGYRGSVNLSVWSSQSPVHDIAGYQGMCATASSSALRAKVQTSACDGDATQNWTLTRGELTHAGKCLNDKGAGGSGSPVVLYGCTHAPDETWSHNSSGQYVLRAHNSKLCLDDPDSSGRNGTQLTVRTCNSSSAGQHWSLPVAR